MNETKKWAVVIGAGPSQVQYIKILKQWGYSILATDQKPGSPGFKFADQYALVSTYEYRQTWEAIQKSIVKEEIKVVLSPTTGEPLRTVNYVAKKLGLPHIDSVDVEDLLHKGRLRKRLNKVARKPIHSGVATNFKDADTVVEKIGFPLVVKPARGGMGGHGVSIVDSVKDLKEAINKACSLSLDGQAVLEQFVEGQELSFSGLLYNGKLYFSTIGKPIYLSNRGSIQVGEVIAPNLLESPLIIKVKEEVLKICHHFGLKNCPLNIDLIIDNDNLPFIVEIEFALADALMMAPVAFNYDLRLNELRVSMGQKPENAKPMQNSCALRYFVHDAPRAKKVEGLVRAKSIPGVVNVKLDEPIKAVYPGRSNNMYLWGHVLSRGQTAAEAENAVEQVIKKLNFHY